MEPHDALGAAPYKVAHDTLVTVDDPGIARQRGYNAPSEFIVRGFIPVWSMAQRVQLNPRQPEGFSDALGQRGFAGAGAPYDCHAAKRTRVHRLFNYPPPAVCPKRKGETGKY